MNLTHDEKMYLMELLEQESDCLSKSEEYVGEYEEEFKLIDSCMEKLNKD